MNLVLFLKILKSVFEKTFTIYPSQMKYEVKIIYKVRDNWYDFSRQVHMFETHGVTYFTYYFFIVSIPNHFAYFVWALFQSQKYLQNQLKANINPQPRDGTCNSITFLRFKKWQSWWKRFAWATNFQLLRRFFLFGYEKK